MQLGSSIVSRLAVLGGIAVGLPSLFACLDHPLKPVRYDAALEVEKVIDLIVNRDVDILFVMDNSGSMGEEQALLASNFSTFIEKLEDPEVRANYRIGVTTSDSGNPVCKETTPEKGALRMSACTKRLTDFVFAPGEPYEIDKQDVACSDICPRGDDFEILASVADDGRNTPRKWMENQEGKTNIPKDWTTTEAFQCFGPQGINGCGFESQLESMYRALQLTNNAESTSYRFMRDNAILAVVIVTDELDCSYNDNYGGIFLPSGAKTFWIDKTDDVPKSGICFKAGVTCTGGENFGSQYSGCTSGNFDANGSSVGEGVANENAVLYPVSKYTNFVQAIETEKKKRIFNQEVIVAVLGGVPIGYSNGDSQLEYWAPDTAEEAATFGVAPGCTGKGEQSAFPPIRMKEFAEGFATPGTRNMYSICNEDFSPALQAIADRIIEQIRPACFRSCAADLEPQEDGLQVDCRVEQQTPDGIDTIVPQCSRDSSGKYRWDKKDYVVPSGHEVCFAILSDQGGDTSDKHDNMDKECIAEGVNLQFQLRRNDGESVPAGTSVQANCQLSDAPDIDCPDL